MQAIKYNEKVWLVNLYNKIFIDKFDEIVEKIEISAKKIKLKFYVKFFFILK